jgi:uncharacterized protein
MAIPMGKLLVRNLPKLVAGSASVLAALYLVLSPRLSPNLYTKKLFGPEKYPEGDWSIKEIGGRPIQDCFFRAVDGSMLHGWFFENPDASHVIMFSHGNRGNITCRQNLVRLLLEAGASVFVYDYRGYGRSEGEPTVHGICEDGLMAFDYLVRGQGFRPSQIVIYGESLGTAVTSEVAAERPCAGIILQSGFSSLRKIGIQMVPITRIYPPALYPKPLLDSASRMAVEKKPLLVIHGVKDQTVPFDHGEEVFNNAAEPKTFLRLSEAAHTDIWSTNADAYVNGVRNWLATLPVDVDPLV